MRRLDTPRGAQLMASEPHPKVMAATCLAAISFLGLLCQSALANQLYRHPINHQHHHHQQHQQQQHQRGPNAAVWEDEVNLHEASSNSNNHDDIDPFAATFEPQPIDLVFPASSDKSQKVQFEWRQQPSNKCSRTCGGGVRLRRFACFDLKYDVRVEEHLCDRAKLERPHLEDKNETCNQVDCPPEWIELEYQECKRTNLAPDNSESGPSEVDRPSPAVKCRSARFKRLQCSMVDKHGQQVYLDEWRCESTNPTTVSNNNNHNHNHSNNKQSQVSSTGDFNLDDIVDLDSLEQSSDRDSNNIVIDESVAKLMLDRPYYETGSWSQCQGASCGQLGQRSRTIACKVHLSRAAKVVELNETSCHSLPRPHVDEPCYVSCSGGSKNLEHIDDEMVDDDDMNRFVWLHTGWTHCNQECNGGQRESLHECLDKQTGDSVALSQCDQMSRPPTKTEACNVAPCEWSADEWSSCSTSCGSTGVRARSVICIAGYNSSGEVHFQSTMALPNELCLDSGPKPDMIEPCNRFDCQPEWIVHNWSDCSRKCGVGIRNRTVFCAKELASPRSSYNLSSAMLDNLEETRMEHLEPEICNELYQTIPRVEELCTNHCDHEPYIDVDPLQDYRASSSSLRRKSVSLKIGGKAELLEGQNLKLRCKVMDRPTEQPFDIDWFKDRLPITEPTAVADEEDNNLILDGKATTSINTRPRRRSNVYKVRGTRSWQRQQQQQQRDSSTSNSNKNNHPHHNHHNQPQNQEARLLVRNNSLRIRRLRQSDSGIYTCSYGSLEESISLRISR